MDMRNLENYIKNRENPFECMSPEAKYWIGYLFADGHFVYDDRHYSISLFSKDEDILMKFKEFIGDKARFYRRPTGICQVIYNSKPVTKWFIDTFNVSNRKAFTLNPTIELDWDIVHGYFDGDGGVFYDKKRNRLTTNTTGTLEVVTTIKDIINSIGIDCNIHRPKQSLDHNTYTLLTCGNKNSLKYLSWMYEDSYIKMIRKFDKYLYGKIKHGTSENLIKPSELYE